MRNFFAGVLAPALLALAGAVLSSAALASGDPEPSASRGALLFKVHCATCHGREARGDGPLADDLRTAPADLTRLRKGGEEAFPAERVREVIDGRRELAGHGSREMPIWGLTFVDTDRADDQGSMAADTIDDLVAHLRTIQVTER